MACSAPYTGIKTNLLFFTKGEPTQDIWYYEHPSPAGVKSYNKTKPIRIEEFDTEKAWWYGETPKKKGKGKKAVDAGVAPAELSYANRIENEHAWKVPLSQIQASGDNLDIKPPTTPASPTPTRTNCSPATSNSSPKCNRPTTS